MGHMGESEAPAILSSFAVGFVAGAAMVQWGNYDLPVPLTPMVALIVAVVLFALAAAAKASERRQQVR